MKGLFIVFHGFAAHNGISKKIFYQCDALRRCGAELRLCSLEVGADGSHRRILDGETLENFGHGLRAKLKKRFSYRSVYRGNLRCRAYGARGMLAPRLKLQISPSTTLHPIPNCLQILLDLLLQAAGFLKALGNLTS